MHIMSTVQTRDYEKSVSFTSKLRSLEISIYSMYLCDYFTPKMMVYFNTIDWKRKILFVLYFSNSG